MKTDFKKTVEAYRATPDRFQIATVPPLKYLMIDGRGDPNTSSAFGEAVETLFPLAFAIKFASKRDLDRDFVVMPLEGLWWAPDMDVFTHERDKSAWQWTLMIMVPEWITTGMFEAAQARVSAKDPSPDVNSGRLERLDEGTCVQTLHVGPFDAEAELLSRMHNEFIPSRNLRMTGKHHEIYLSDFRKTAPEKLRTILRQPVEEA